MDIRLAGFGRKPVVSIIGGSFGGNRGAAAMLETSIGKIREFLPQACFNIYTPYPVKDKILIGNETHLRFFDSRPKALIHYTLGAFLAWLASNIGINLKLSKALQAIAESDVLLDISGISFADGRLKFLPYNILMIYPAMLLDTPLVKMSQALGPFHNPIIRMCVNTFLPHCQQIFARGEKTLTLLRGLGLKEETITLSSDIAFLYSPEFCFSFENRTAVEQVCRKLEKFKKQGTKIIAISPSVLVMKKSQSKKIDYILILLRTIELMSANDIHFVVFPTASYERSKKTRNNDIHIIDQMRAEAEHSLPNPLNKRITWMSYEMSTHGIEEVVRHANVLVTSRFHAMVFGLTVAIPTLVIGWGHKYLEVMQHYNLEKYVFDFNDSNRDLSVTIKEMLVAETEIQARMNEVLVEMRDSSYVQFEYLKRFFRDFEKNS